MARNPLVSSPSPLSPPCFTIYVTSHSIHSTMTEDDVVSEEDLLDSGSFSQGGAVDLSDKDSTSDAQDNKADDLATESVSVCTNRLTFNYASEKYNFNERLSFYTPGNIFHSKFTKAIQAARIFEAGQRVYASCTKKDPDLKEQFRECYDTVVSELDDTYIDDCTKDSLCSLFGARQENANQPMDGNKIAKKFAE